MITVSRKLLASVVVFGALALGAQETPVKEEVKKESRKEESSVPDWVKKLEIKGDFRFRYQYQNFEDAVQDDTLERNRLLYRARIGLDAEVNDWAKVHFGIASGSAETKISENMPTQALGQDARTSNQPFDDFFSRKPLWIDHAYGEISPWSWLTIMGGKMKNPLHTASQLLWSAEVNPEGAAVTFAYPIIDELTILADAAILVLDEIKALDDPLLAVAQVGAAVTVDDFDGKFVIGYYDPMYLYNADSNTAHALEIKKLIREGYYWKNIQALFNVAYTLEKKYQIGLFGEMTANLYEFNEEAPLGEKADETLAWLVGAKGGTKALKDLGDFQLTLGYRQAGIASWLPLFSEPVVFNGKLNGEGIDFNGQVGFYKGLSAAVTFNYFWTKNAEFNAGETDSDIIFMLDMNYKF